MAVEAGVLGNSCWQFKMAELASLAELCRKAALTFHRLKYAGPLEKVLQGADMVHLLSKHVQTVLAASYST